MPGWEKVKLKINDYEAVDHKKACLKEKMYLKSQIMIQIRQITIQWEDPGNEETTEKRRALGTRMVPKNGASNTAAKRIAHEQKI